MPISAIMPHLLAFLLIVVLPVWDRYETRRLKTSRDPRVKIQSYQITIGWLWICAAIAVVQLGWRSLWTIRLNPGEVRWLPTGNEAFIFGVAMCAVFLGASVIPVVGARFSSKVRDGFARQLAPLGFFLPGTAEERLWFVLVSISAGVCEEILFRGFLIRYFQAGPYHLTVVFAVLVSCAFFGTAHFYQGALGVLQTALLGLLFAFLFLATGSLTWPVLAHVATDLKVLMLLKKEVVAE